MNFRKKQINKSKQQENNISVIRNANGTGSVIAKVLFVWIVIIGLAFVTNEQLKEKSTDDSLASVDVTTALTTSIVTTTETTTSASTVTTATKKEIVKITVLATSVSVPATEQTTTTTEVVVTEPEPVHEEPQIVEEIVPEPEPVYEEPEVHEEVVQEEPQPVEEEPVVENNNNQQYYSDDGDHGWSYVSCRYGLPDISLDRERYHAALDYVSEEERVYLINVVTSEYGSDYVPLYEKAKVVAVVMNRLHNGYWGDSISSVLSYPGQFVGYYLKDGFYGNTTPECIDAVDYYFLHKDDSMYNGIMYISGGGGWNSFY